MASDNLLEIVNGILDISKIEAGKLEIINTEYDFNKVTTELIALTRGRLGDKPIELITKIDASIPQVLYGDASRLKQICVNILTNAVKYTKEGSIIFSINSVIKNDVCRLIISVEDTGIGIKQENLNKLFNKFERLDLKDNITIEGTGLGLAITKKLVDMMNGKIVVQSVFGKGSKFTVSIDQGIVKNPTIKVEAINTTHEKIEVKNKTVLVVDDNKINLKVAERLLQTYGVLVECVESGFICIDNLKSGKKYDLILMDDMMPRMSGVETLQKIKVEIPEFDIPVISLTANALTGMREKYLADGFNDYLAKPINKDELNSLGQPYGEALPNKKDKNTELQVYVTYALQINNQSTQHNATGVKVKYSYDEGYEYVGDVEGTVNDEKNKILTISNINLVPGESKKITLKFKVRKNEDGTFFKKPSDTSKYTNVAEIVEYSTTEGRLVDADSAPGNTFLGENKPTTRREDDTDTANGSVG